MFISHHGILKQKWGVRNGPPYPLSGGDYSKSEYFAIKRKRALGRNNIYNKKHFDTIIKEKEKLSTLSYDPNRTKDTDMFYATHDKFDKAQYNVLFNKRIEQPIYDEKGNNIGTGKFLKYKINNELKSDIKVASEDSASKVFLDMYSKDRDFYNFVTDKTRMQSYFVEDKYKFRGYRESKANIDKITGSKKQPTDKEIMSIYRMFNYVIPYDGAGNDARGAKDVATQRAKFFKKLKDSGYSAVLDTNDAIYGGFKARDPVIMFDMDKIASTSSVRTTQLQKNIDTIPLSLRKVLGL